MSNIKYLYIILILIIFLCTISISLSDDNRTNNSTRSIYDYEDDEDEEDRKKRKNETFIIYLDDANYTNIIRNYEALFVMFYPSPCPNCKLVMPHYVRLSHYVYEQKIDLKFAKVDGTKNEQLVKKFNIDSYPKVILLLNNKTYY